VGQPTDRADDDADLVRAARLGAREPFAELVRRHQNMATALAARVLGSEDLARDAVQEAVVAAMTGLDRLRSADRFGPWFCGIALNVSRRWRRQLRAELPDGAGPDRIPAGAGPDELAELADLAARVRAAIASLADGQRDAVFLFYLQGLSHREVAAELGVSVGAVKARLHQARAALAPRLSPLVDTQEVKAMTSVTDATEWIDVTVAEVLRDEREPGEHKHIMVLEAADGRGSIPIWVGPAEAIALAMTLQSVETPRPLTYQLTVNLLRATGARITEARVTRLDGTIFYAVLVVDGPQGRQEVDARPSDAVTLAAVVGAPIRAEAQVFALPAEARIPERPHGFTGTAELAAETEQRLLRQRARDSARPAKDPAHDPNKD
jgi:RNA polymerase sigma-70 factor (ECF subfamily)